MISNNPKMVIFEERECCALRMAFRENRSQLNEFLKDFVPRRIVDLCETVLAYTWRLGWVPEAEDHMLVFRALAILELRRLASVKSPAMYCSCEKEGHIEALQKVKFLMGGDITA